MILTQENKMQSKTYKKRGQRKRQRKRENMYTIHVFLFIFIHLHVTVKQNGNKKPDLQFSKLGMPVYKFPFCETFTVRYSCFPFHKYSPLECIQVVYSERQREREKGHKYVQSLQRCQHAHARR